MTRSSLADQPWLGAILMAIAMLTYPIADAATKYLSAGHSAIGVTWARLTVCALLMAPLALAVTQGPLVLDQRTIIEQMVRAVLVFAATVLFIVSITLVPLANAVGAYLIGPIVASVLAVRVLGEPWSFGRAIAVLVGFTGAMIIVRPGVSMAPGSLYALAAGTCYGGFLVANRACRRPVHPFTAVAFQMTLGALVLTPFAWRETEALLAEDWWLLVLIGLPSAIANVLVVIALTIAPAAFLAPLVYLEVVGATALGFLVFGDVPSASIVFGIGLIVLSGLSIAYRPAPHTPRLR